MRVANKRAFERLHKPRTIRHRPIHEQPARGLQDATRRVGDAEPSVSAVQFFTLLKRVANVLSGQIPTFQVRGHAQ